MAAKSARILILGGGYAGLLAALRTARLVRGRGEVTLVNAVPDFCERIRLHQRAAGQAVPRISIAELLDKVGARLVVGRATALDVSGRAVIVDGQRLGYDRLVYALGSRSIEVPHAMSVEDPRLEAASATAKSLVVVGGGLTAIETAAELAEARPGLRVSLLAGGEIAECLQPRAREIARQSLQRLGVDVREHTAVSGAEPGRAVTASGFVPADVVVWTAGFRAAPLAAEAGLACDAQGRVLVDARLLALGAPEIVVAGDAAAMPVAMACKTAMPMGAHAAAVIAASVDGAEPPAHRFADTGVCVSLGRHDGVVELRRGDGTPSGTVWRGRWAAFVKEAICRYTRWSLRVEATGQWRYRWMRGKQPLLLNAPVQKELAA